MIKAKIKAYLSVFLLLAVTLSCAILLTGCGDKVEQIYVDNSCAPRLTYVQGQDLDLRNGMITAIIGEEESLIPMTDEGVTVTGYDKNTLGSQTLTVTYQEQTTTITVNVIPRLSAEGFETSYFTGDNFKADKGKLKVAKDDASTSMVTLDDPRVTVEGFDSTTAGEKTVTAQYSDGTNTYTCTFNVTVYDAKTSTITIVCPKKTSYGSHETGLDLTGGYITIKGGADGKLEKHVDLTEEMTSGWNFSAVNAENPNATQIVTITYLGKTAQYTIRIKYSGVSIVQDNLAVIKDADLAALTGAQKEASWTAISEYLELKDAEKELFSEDDVNTIIRIASVGVTELYREELEDYKDTILVVNEGIQLACKTYDKTVSDLARFKDSSEMLNRYATILRTLLADYPNLAVSGDKTVKDEVFVMPKDIQDNLIAILEHLTSLYKDMILIPEDWTVESLIAMDNDSNQNMWAEPRLYRIRVDIATAPYYKGGQGNIYNVLTNWRSDYFDILYSYYLYCNDTYGGAETVVSMLDNIPWPQKIGEWYSCWYMVMNYSSSLKKAVEENELEKVFMTDLSPYYYYFKVMQDMAANIKQNQSTDQLTYDLYNLIAGDARINMARYDTYGQLKLGGFLGDETKFGEMWSVYLELVDLYANGKLVAEDGSIIVQGYESKYEAVMNKLFELSPIELHEFLGSLNFYYGKTTSDIYALSAFSQKVDGEYRSTYLSTLATLINAYYKSIFNDTEFEMFEKLLVAMESYARTNKVDSAMDTFKTNMAEVIAAYGKLENTALFDAKVGAGYTAYVKLYEACKSETNMTGLSDAAQKHINTILDEAVKFENIRDYLVAENAKDESERNIRNEAYMVLFSLYEKIRYSYLSLADMAEEDENIRLALYKNIYEYDGAELTVEQIFGKVGNHFWTYMIGMPDLAIKHGENTYAYKLYDIYLSPDLTTFLYYAADMLYAQFNGSEVNEFSVDDFNKMVDAYNKLDASMVVAVLDIFKTNELYFSFIDSYIDAVVTDEDTYALSAKLIEAARAYAQCLTAPTEDHINSFKALMAAAEDLKNLLTSESDYQKYLQALYDHYAGAVAALDQPQQ